jgi:hypothetical protein
MNIFQTLTSYVLAQSSYCIQPVSLSSSQASLSSLLRPSSYPLLVATISELLSTCSYELFTTSDDLVFGSLPVLSELPLALTLRVDIFWRTLRQHENVLNLNIFAKPKSKSFSKISKCKTEKNISCFCTFKWG